MLHDVFVLDGIAIAHIFGTDFTEEFPGHVEPDQARALGAPKPKFVIRVAVVGDNISNN